MTLTTEGTSMSPSFEPGWIFVISFDQEDVKGIRTTSEARSYDTNQLLCGPLTRHISSEPAPTGKTSDNPEATELEMTWTGYTGAESNVQGVPSVPALAVQGFPSQATGVQAKTPLR